MRWRRLSCRRREKDHDDDNDLHRLFAEADAAVAKFDPDSVAFWDDCQVEFRRVQKARRADLSKTEWLELFAAWRARQETILAVRRAQRQRRFEMLIQEQTALMYYLPRPRSDEENKRLYNVSLEIGTMLALRSPSARYRGPLGERPGAA